MTTTQGSEHDFFADRARSHKADELPFWETVYREAFPEFQSMTSHREDGEHQRAGIDRSIILKNSKQILIDEKIRGRSPNGKVYQDIALEFEHEYTNGRILSGWVCKPQRADYIAYSIAPLGICYLLPIRELQRAYKIHCDNWRRTYFIAESPNRGYITRSVCVPVSEVYQAIGACLRLKFNPTEVEE